MNTWTIRDHLEAMFERRKRAVWREGRGENILASYDSHAARWHERQVRMMLNVLYG